MSPIRLWHHVCLLGILVEQVRNRGRLLLDLARHVKQIHLVVSLPDLVGQAAGPRLDAVEGILVLVVPRLADVHLLARRQASRPAPVVAGVEHDEAAVHDVVDPVVAVLARLHDLVSVEALRHAVDCLLRTVVPARVDPFLSRLVLPESLDLRNYGLLQVVHVADVNPVA